MSGAARGQPWRHANLRVGAVLVAIVVGLALLSYVSTSRTSCSRRARRTGSAPTASAATSQR
jgi:hypothetical protein